MTIKCISPIDGSVYAERQALSRSDADAAVIRANTAQKEWNMRPIEERIELVRLGVAAIGAMNEEIVPEIAPALEENKCRIVSVYAAALHSDTSIYALRYKSPGPD